VGGENLIEWDVPVWEHDLAGGLRMFENVTRTHLVTSHFALRLLTRTPGGLVVEMTDGTRAYNESTYRVSTFYDLSKAVPLRLAFTVARELAAVGGTAVALTPGWLRSEMMLEHMGDRGELAGCDRPALRRHLREPALRRPGRRRVGR
jgi:NAD(P)-dependent dehydrogenase (short-subunit alcohol dehydrogenase family)